MHSSTQQNLAGILIVTHGDLGAGLVSTLELIMGPQLQLAYLSINQEDDFAAKSKIFFKYLETLNTGKGVVVLTDLFGGTPSNLAISAIGNYPIEVLAGVNLPMLIKLVEIRASSLLPEASQKAFEAGRKYIQIASGILGQPVSFAS